MSANRIHRLFNWCLTNIRPSAVGLLLLLLIQAAALTAPALSQEAVTEEEEGELIELEAVQIHGEIAQPNVAITVARAQPQFREITLERTLVEGLTDLDFTKLVTETPEAARIEDWTELLERIRE